MLTGLVIFFACSIFGISTSFPSNEQLGFDATTQSNRASSTYFIYEEGTDTSNCGYIKEAIPCRTIGRAISQMVVDGRQKDVHVGVGVFSESGIVIQVDNVHVQGQGVQKTNITNENSRGVTVFDVHNSFSLNLTRITILSYGTSSDTNAIIVIRPQGIFVLYQSSMIGTTETNLSPFIIGEGGIIRLIKSTISSATFTRVPAVRCIISQQADGGQFTECVFQQIKTNAPQNQNSTSSALDIDLQGVLLYPCRIERCLFDQCGMENSSQSQAGAIYIKFNAGVQQGIILNQTLFSQNRGLNVGSVLISNQPSTLQFIQCLFRQNILGTSSADVYFTQSGQSSGQISLFFSRCTSDSTSTTNPGNKIYVQGASQSEQTSLNGILRGLGRDVFVRGNVTSDGSNNGTISSPIGTVGSAVRFASQSESFGASILLQPYLVSGEFGPTYEQEVITIGWLCDQTYRPVKRGPQLTIKPDNSNSTATRYNCIIQPQLYNPNLALIHLRSGMLTIANITIRATLSIFQGVLIFAEYGEVTMSEIIIKDAITFGAAVSIAYSVDKVSIDRCVFNNISNINGTTRLTPLFSSEAQHTPINYFAGSGALYVEVGAGQSASLTDIYIRRTEFTGCSTTRSGGALQIMVVENDGVAAEELIVEEQESIIYSSRNKNKNRINGQQSNANEPLVGRIEVEQCTFTNCRSSTYGGAVHIAGSFHGTGSNEEQLSDGSVHTTHSSITAIATGLGAAHADIRFFFCRFLLNRDGNLISSDVYWQPLVLDPTVDPLIRQEIEGEDEEEEGGNGLVTCRIEDIFVSCSSTSILPKSLIKGEDYDNSFSPSFTTIYIKNEQASDITSAKGSPSYPFQQISEAIESIPSYTLTPITLLLQDQSFETSQALIIDNRHVSVKREFKPESATSAASAVVSELGSNIWIQSDKDTQTQFTASIYPSVSFASQNGVVQIRGVGALTGERIWFQHLPPSFDAPLISGIDQSTVQLTECRFSGRITNNNINNIIMNKKNAELQRRPFVELKGGQLLMDSCVVDPIIFIDSSGGAFVGSNLQSLSIAGTKFNGVLVQSEQDDTNSSIPEQGSECVIKAGLVNGSPASIINCLFDGNYSLTEQRQIPQGWSKGNCPACSWSNPAVYIYGDSSTAGTTGGTLTLKSVTFNNCYGGALRLDALSAVRIHKDCHFERTNWPRWEVMSDYHMNILATTALGDQTYYQTGSGSRVLMAITAERSSFIGENWRDASARQRSNGNNFCWVDYDEGVLFLGSIAEGGVSDPAKLVPAIAAQALAVDADAQTQQRKLDDQQGYAIFNIPSLSSVNGKNIDSEQNIIYITVKGSMLFGCSKAGSFNVEIYEQGSQDVDPYPLELPLPQAPFGARKMKIILESSHLVESNTNEKNLLYAIPFHEFQFAPNVKYFARISYGLNGRKSKEVKVSL